MWYYFKVALILGTVVYQNKWMEENGWRCTKEKTPLQKLIVWLLILTPIVNTFFALACLFLLTVHAFYEDIIVQSFEQSDYFEKIR